MNTKLITWVRTVVWKDGTTVDYGTYRDPRTKCWHIARRWDNRAHDLSPAFFPGEPMAAVLKELHQDANAMEYCNA